MVLLLTGEEARGAMPEYARPNNKFAQQSGTAVEAPDQVAPSRLPPADCPGFLLGLSNPPDAGYSNRLMRFPDCEARPQLAATGRELFEQAILNLCPAMSPSSNHPRRGTNAWCRFTPERSVRTAFSIPEGRIPPLLSSEETDTFPWGAQLLRAAAGSLHP
jgi:hypothetical protein